ncbi:exonuclease domain-containing protein [Apilactobacillus ozensis]|uniref:exonuclease domain-containing protein n=1 Tax=Apilactobacillus ozensis TaxID=866801 RepID=UPI00200A501F|nr:exonuclease domain-containing protein [Apilactobacillus ozensis]MCK8606533.1 hypothetical protein [Apilactobacillus ozensis]
MKNSIFSVVDIETTGSDMSEDANRIIQFSCTFIKNNKITDSYNVYINPQMSIPSRITDLTGIDNDKVSTAVSFEDVAHKIYEMLNGTTFIAHNINFDLPFLNKEFARVGYKPLDVKGYDTVTLSQILMPTMESYRLRDLSNTLGIVHKHPHSSASDAFATAKIFILLSNYARKLPKSVISGILKIKPSLPMNTLDFFESYKDFEKSCNNNLCVKNGFYLQKVDNSFNNSRDKFDKCKKAYTDKVSQQDNSLESSISKNINRNPILIDADSVDYNKVLQPIIYGNKVVFSTNNIKLLQKQILQLNLPDNTVSLHSPSEYIDLYKFKSSLKYDSKSKKTKFIKCQVLVWLTVTKTGLLSEINANYNDIDYFKEISSNYANGNYYLKNFDRKLKKSNVVLISHDYLINNRDQLLETIGSKNYNLVINNATNFNATFLNNLSANFQFNYVFTLIRKFQSDLHQTHYTNLYDVFKNSKYISNIRVIDKGIKKINRNFEIVFTAFKKLFITKSSLIANKDGYKCIFSNRSLINFFNDYKATINEIEDLMSYVANKTFNVKSNSVIMNKFICNFMDLSEFIGKIRKIRKLLGEYENVFQCMLTVNKDKNIDNAIFEAKMISSSGLIKQKIYDNYKNVAFIDCDWLIASCYDYVYKQLELNGKRVKKMIFKNKFSGDNKFLVFKGYNDSGSKVKFINKLTEETDFKTFVLTDSTCSTEKYFLGLHDSELSDLYSIYARDITGNNYKILKKMSNHSRFVTIGNSRLEHMLSSENNADILIIDSISDYFKNNYLKENSVNVARYTLHLYNNIMHFINTNPNGTVIVWDDINSNINFSKFFQKYIPNFKTVNSYIEN